MRLPPRSAHDSGDELHREKSTTQPIENNIGADENIHSMQNEKSNVLKRSRSFRTHSKQHSRHISDHNTPLIDTRTSTSRTAETVAFEKGRLRTKTSTTSHSRPGPRRRSRRVASDNLAREGRRALQSETPRVRQSRTSQRHITNTRRLSIVDGTSATPPRPSSHTP